MSITNIAGYKFIALTELASLREALLTRCSSLDLKGTILISVEGINLSLAGTSANITAFRAYLAEDTRFSAIPFCISYSAAQPFKHMRVKIKKEIITMGVPAINVTEKRAPSISAQEFKQWLDEKRDITVLDTRNDYEIQFGAFAQAKHLDLEDFRSFPSAIKRLDPALKTKPIVTYCTGGIRCEKAALELIAQGFTEVYQLERGILNYFATCGAEHYEGKCFVFDERVALNDHLDPIRPT